MTDLVERLRERKLFKEAADEIERLRDELKWCETAKDQAMMMVDALQKKLEGEMTDILSRLRGDIPHRLIEDHWTVDFDALDAEREEAADEIERLRSALVQYRDDLFYLPTGEEKLRKIKMVKQLLEGK